MISASMSQIQAIILSKRNPEMLLRSRPEIAATLDTSLTGCMVVFSCLDEEVREVLRHAGGKARLSWRGRVKTIWKQETFQELLDSMRGQQLAINTLIQLLQMYACQSRLGWFSHRMSDGVIRDSLFEITELLQQKGPELRKTVERTESLRRSYSSVRIAESIFNHEDRMSIYSAADSIMASSELEFDFDNIVVNSKAYRRVMAAVRNKVSTPESETPYGDLVVFLDNDTRRQASIDETTKDVLASSTGLVGHNFSTSVCIKIVPQPRKKAFSVQSTQI